MPLALADGVKETTVTTGTGTISLAGAPTGLRSFVGAGLNGQTVAYRIDNGTGDWEETWGTVASGTPDTITRGTLIKSSTGSRVSFAAGSKTVSIVPLVDLFITPAASGALAESSIASAATTDLGSVTTLRAAITGTTGISSFGSQPTALRFVRFVSGVKVTYNGTSMKLLGSNDKIYGGGDQAVFVSDGSGNWTELLHNRFAFNQTCLNTKSTQTPGAGAVTVFTLPTSINNQSNSIKLMVNAYVDDGNLGYASEYSEWSIYYGSFGGSYQAVVATRNVQVKRSVNSGVIDLAITITGTIAANVLSIKATVVSGGSTGVTTAHIDLKAEALGPDHGILITAA